MDDLREYRVNLNGSESTAMLTEADARRLGGVLIEPAIDGPETKAVVPEDKARRVVRNAARRTRNKGG